ncbi:50S ribosomal protein L18e [archaeon]|nr:50S ribosomal protein L18e [archaeon]
MKRGTTNTQLAETIMACKKTKKRFWKAVAFLLERPSRMRVEVNLWEIGKNAKEGETIVVPGRVLGAGELSQNVKVAAFWFSKSAKDKLGAKALSLTELVSTSGNEKLKIMA